MARKARGRRHPVNAVISLRVRKKVGAVGHLANALPKYGLTYSRHDVFGSAADQCRVDIQAKGSDPLLDEIPSGLRNFDEVLEVLNIRTSVERKGNGPPLSDSGQDDTVVNEIVWAFPRIRSLVAEYEEKVSPGECVHRMTKLGAQVGKHLGTGRLSPLADVHEGEGHRAVATHKVDFRRRIFLNNLQGLEGLQFQIVWIVSDGFVYPLNLM